MSPALRSSVLLSFCANTANRWTRERSAPLSRDPVPQGEKIEEERRLFYVGVTRAKRLLCLTHANNRRDFKGFHQQVKVRAPSPRLPPPLRLASFVPPASIVLPVSQSVSCSDDLRSRAVSSGTCTLASGTANPRPADPPHLWAASSRRVGRSGMPPEA